MIFMISALSLLTKGLRGKKVQNRKRPSSGSTSNSEKRAYTEMEAALYTGMSRSFLRKYRLSSTRRRRPTGPRFVKIGRSIRYLQDDLDRWLERHRVGRLVVHEADNSDYPA